jgi:hypothetical protein
MTAELMALLLMVKPPPHEFDHPFEGMIVQYATLEEIERECGYDHAIGCALITEASDGTIVKCTLLLPHGNPVGNRLYRHERAHCNGWRH